VATPNDTLQQFAPVYDYIPEDWQEARRLITNSLRVTTEVANDSVKPFYIEQEVLAGKRWEPSARSSLNEPNTFRNVFRKVVDLGGLNDFSTTSPQNVAHGIDTTENTFITALYGAATDPAASSLNSAFPLPYVDTSALSACIELRMDDTNLILVSGTDYSAYTEAWVVIEYVQEA